MYAEIVDFYRAKRDQKSSSYRNFNEKTHHEIAIINTATFYEAQILAKLRSKKRGLQEIVNFSPVQQSSYSVS